MNIAKAFGGARLLVLAKSSGGIQLITTSKVFYNW
jgi:hypothetical protein